MGDNTVSTAQEGFTEMHRVNQLDSLRLDEELLELFKSQLLSSVRMFKSSTLDNLQPELMALLRLAYFWLTIKSDVPSPGNRYQNLRYRDGASKSVSTLRTVQKVGLGFLQVLLRYLWTRLERTAANRRWGESEPGSPGRIAWRAMRVIERAYNVLSTINFALFLWRGVYRSLEDRLTNSRLDWIRPNAVRTVTFEFLNRQLVWEGFTDFVIFMTPLLRSSRWIGSLRVKIASALGILVGGQAASRSNAADNAMDLTEEAQYNCLICETSTMIMPHYALPCHHRFCYACIASKIESEPSCTCPRCSRVIEEIAREGVS